jgi:hypothetical protein
MKDIPVIPKVTRKEPILEEELNQHPYYENHNMEIDLNKDGVVDSYEQIVYERKARNRRRMAWLSLIALIASGFCLMFLVPASRLPQLNGILELYWLSLGGIVGAYVGMSAWASRK